MRTLSEFLFLKPGELRRAWPFFAFYLLVFGAFSLADGLSVALFVMRVGAESLPLYYGITAAANLVVIGGYVLVAERVGAARMFQAILGGTVLVYAAAWAALRWLEGPPEWYGALFVTREVAFTLVLMHFGTYLQDYFRRDELNRVLPVVYAGGRVGGIAGGWLLERLSRPLGPLNVVPVYLGLCLACMVVLAVLSRRSRTVEDREGGRGEPGVVPPAAEGATSEGQACASPVGFLRFVWASPLLFWTTISSVLFMVARWLLNYQYNDFFQGYFADSLELAEFLGRYTQVALVVSLVIQLVIVNRLVAWFGVGGAYLGYGVLVCAGTLLCVLPMTLAVAVFCRLLETELRFGLRNPLMQLISNQFGKALRLRVRAWTMGLLTPLGTVLASALLGGLVLGGSGGWIPWAGGAVGLAYLGSAWGLFSSLRKRPGLGEGDGARRSGADS